MPTQYVASAASDRTVKFVYGLCKYQVANEGCVTLVEGVMRVHRLKKARTEKQVARLLVGMYMLSKLFSPSSEPP